jgi:hypothetical protein
MNLKWEHAIGKALMSCVAVLGLSAPVYASQDLKCGDKKPNFAFAYPKDMHLVNPCDWYAYAEGLAMQGMESNLEFVVVNSGTPETTLDGKLGGFGQDDSWDYNFGLRVGTGVYLNHDAWNVDASWMWLNVTNSKSYEAGSGSTLPVLLPDSGSSFDSRRSSGANWGCVFNVEDLTLGKPYHISRKVVFNPHFGVRFANIGQDLTVNYGGTTPADAVKFKASNDFFGVGGRIGVDTEWAIVKGLKLFANVSSSILAGWFDVEESFAVADTAINGKLTSESQEVVPNLDLALGLDWGFRFCDCKYNLNFRGGYEFQVWWDQLHLRQPVTGGTDGNFINVPLNGNLTLNGFTFRIQLDM